MSGQEKLSAQQAPAAPRKKAAEKLSETARDLFYRRGIRAVGVDEIVNEAGVTKPSLYRSFPSKDDLAVACLKQCESEMCAAWENAVASAPGDPCRQLDTIMDSYAEMLVDTDYRGCPVSNAAVEFPEPGHPVHELTHAAKRQMRERLVAITSQLGPNGAALADGLILLMEGASASRHTFCGKGPAAAFRASARALIEGLAGEAKVAQPG